MGWCRIEKPAVSDTAGQCKRAVPACLKQFVDSRLIIGYFDCLAYFFQVPFWGLKAAAEKGPEILHLVQGGKVSGHDLPIALQKLAVKGAESGEGILGAAAYGAGLQLPGKIRILQNASADHDGIYGGQLL